MKNEFSTKAGIREYIEEHTAYLNREEEMEDGKNKFSAIKIAEKFNISRNLASQYLNEWVKEEVLQKTSTRPVYFYSNIKPRQKLNYIEKVNVNNEYKKYKEDKKEDIFSKIIGFEGSLNNVITQSKAAIKYPPNGLPILLNGTSGSGKSFFAGMIYKYAIEEKIINNDKQFVIVNCSEFANNPELLTANLFGYKKGAFTGADSDNMGLIQAADGGILFLDEVHSLNASCQEKLFLFMDKGIYHLMGDNKTWKKSTAKLIFATTKKPEDALLKTLLRRIPVIIRVPSLEERPADEKEQLIFSFINNESKEIQKKIKVTKAYFSTLMNFKFKANVGELKSAIKISCANAYLHEEYDDEQSLILKVPYLPENIILQTSFFALKEYDDDDNELIDPDKTEISVEGNKIILLYEEIINVCKKYESIGKDNEKFLSDIKKIINKYYDYLMFAKKRISIDIFDNPIEKIVEYICAKYKIQFHNNGMLLMGRYLLDENNYRYYMYTWYQNNKYIVDKLYNDLYESYEYEFNIVNDFADKCKKNIDISMSKINRIIILFNMIFFNTKLKESRTVGIVLCHGYSTASSIAEAVNQFLDDYLFEAIDMPLDVTSMEIGEKLLNLIKKRHLSQDIILMVDMGSLQEIYKEINLIAKFNIGIINNVTTKMALEIGSMIKENKSIEEILRVSSERNVSNYKIIQNRIKKKAVLFVSENGVDAAKNISELFIKSLPKAIDADIIPYDHLKLIRNGRSDEIFSNNDIVFIAGTVKVKIENVPYISIEDIINGNNLEKFDSALSEVYTENEIHELQKNLLINFSLQNVIEYLTILNAKKVLELVNSGLDKLQQKIKVELKSNGIIGMNVHLSCLVERLVKKIYINQYGDPEEFKKNHRDFIEVCRESFEEIEQHYGVEFPISEIAYIYDYFKAYI